MPALRSLKSARTSVAVVVLSSLPVLQGCGGSPTTPASATPMLTGYVYEVMMPGTGEPPISDVLITVTQDDGGTSSARTDDAGFYSVRATTGPVVVTATKDGYRTRESRFDVTDSTVLNFALRPTSD